MLAVMAISLYTSRIILQNLGVMDYGLYSVVGGIAVTFMFLNTAMNSSTQRYLTISIGKGEDEELHKVFNVSNVIHFLIGIIIVVVCEIFGLWFIFNKMTIPDGRETAVLWTFQLSLIAVFVTIISVPYNALLISREKMSAFAYISIADVIFKLFIAYIISIVHFDRLIFYALLIVISQILIRMLYVIYCKRNFRECSFKFYKFDSLYKDMTIFASWGLLGHIAWIINTSVQDMLLNVFFTPVINAARGLAIKVTNAVSGFSDNFQTAVSPQITKAYAVGNIERTYSLIYNSTRFSFYLLWILSLPLILCMDEILGIWLTEVPPYTSIFLTLVLVHNIIASGANPLNMAIRAKGQIKYPEIFGGLILILNLPLSYIALKLGYPPQSVFVILILCRVLNQILRIYFAHRYLSMPIFTYLRKVMIRPVGVMLLSLSIPLATLNYIFFENDGVKTIVICIISLISCAVTIFYLGINVSEKKYIKTYIKNKIQ